MSALCPVCRKDDAIQRLSAVVSSGRASGTFSGPSVGVAHVDGKWDATGGYTALSGATATDLARKLSPPSKPDKPSGLGCWLYVLVGFFGFGAFVAFFNWVGETRYRGEHITLLMSLVSLAIVALILVGDMNKKSRARAKYAEEKPAWDAAMKRYERLYFCFRDDVVFDPQTGETCQTESLKEFMYSSG